VAKTPGDAAQEVAEAAAEKAQEVAEESETLTPDALADVLGVGKGFRLADVDTRGTPGFDGDKAAGKAALTAGAERLSGLQERLFAEGTAGGSRSVLLVVQGMDTSGKGGIMRHVMGSVDPQGVHLRSFKAPTEEERAHDFLWRIEKALPRPGFIGVFDRSHYEDVLIARVRSLAPVGEVEERYEQINDFERRLADQGTTVVKAMLHISKQEQKERLGERLDRPDKYWKYNPGDVDERLLWDSYQEAYQLALTRCSTRAARWHVVPADRKWYARWAVQQLLLDALTDLDPQWPPADFDVEAEKARLAAS
jgi:PPK2 family polyphosphate:nucleotide phosphotransferase